MMTAANRKPKVIIDKNIPFIQGVLEPYCSSVEYLPGGAIDRESAYDKDALLVRTRTKCNASLLEGSSVSFIASATIGTDHLDLDFLSKNHIEYSNAPGCNACGVMQYVITSLFYILSKKKMDLRGATLGVIGAGNTGERVARMAELLGLNVLRNDPPKGEKTDLETLLKESDVISCHLPLTSDTINLIDESKFSLIKDGAIFVNASRGEVVDEQALLKHSHRLGGLVMDVWRNEPDGINRELLSKADVVTPHIAGYSYEGKINGTAAVVQKFAEHFGIESLKDFVPLHSATPKVVIPNGVFKEETIEVDYYQKVSEFADSLLDIFPLEQTSQFFRVNPEKFEQIRNEYDYRREFSVPEYISKLTNQ